MGDSEALVTRKEGDLSAPQRPTVHPGSDLLPILTRNPTSTAPAQKTWFFKGLLGFPDSLVGQLLG